MVGFGSRWRRWDNNFIWRKDLLYLRMMKNWDKVRWSANHRSFAYSFLVVGHDRLRWVCVPTGWGSHHVASIRPSIASTMGKHSGELLLVVIVTPSNGSSEVLMLGVGEGQFLWRGKEGDHAISNAILDGSALHSHRASGLPSSRASTHHDGVSHGFES